MALLRMALFVFLYIVINFNLGFSSWSVIRDSDEWSVYSIDSTNMAVESYILKTIDELKYNETGRDYWCCPRVKYRYGFRNFPNIKIYELFTCEEKLNYNTNYDWVIFNLADSSLYHFGGDLRSFNAVFSDYLKINYDNKNIIKLLWLYFNTLDNDDITYHIMNNINDFESLYNIYRIQSPDIKKEEEIAIVNEVIKPIRIQTLEFEEFRIKLCKNRLYTWKWPSGSIEEWHIMLSKDRITIDNVKELVKQVGPHY